MDGEIDPAELAAVLGVEADGDGEADSDGEADGDGERDERSSADSAAGTLRIVDIRNARAFDRGHIPDSENIPFPELTTRVTELEGAERIVTVCPHGIASQQAAQLVGSYAGTTDARVESLAGGLEAWEREYPLCTDHGSGSNADSDRDDEPDEGPNPDAPF